jgi:hypothetical protein
VEFWWRTYPWQRLWWVSRLYSLLSCLCGVVSNYFCICTIGCCNFCVPRLFRTSTCSCMTSVLLLQILNFQETHYITNHWCMHKSREAFMHTLPHFLGLAHTPQPV